MSTPEHEAKKQREMTPAGVVGKRPPAHSDIMVENLSTVLSEESKSIFC